MAESTLEIRISRLVEAYLFEEGSIQTSAEIQKARLTDESLRDFPFYPANFCLYDLEKDETVGVHDPDGEPVLYFGGRGNNPIFNFPIEGYRNLEWLDCDDFVYNLSLGDSHIRRAVARAKKSALRVKLADLVLQDMGLLYDNDSVDETAFKKMARVTSYYVINPSDCDALTPAQKALAEAVHGTGQQFVDVMKRIGDLTTELGLDYPSIIVRSPEFVKEHAKEAPFFNAALLDHEWNGNNFFACQYDNDEPRAIYGKLKNTMTESTLEEDRNCWFIGNSVVRSAEIQKAQFEEGSIRTSAEIQEARLRDKFLRDVTFYPANFCLYDLENDSAVGVHDPDGEAVLYFGEREDNPIFCDILHEYMYLNGFDYNSLPAGVVEALATRAKKSALLRVKLADLILQPSLEDEINIMYYQINFSDNDALTPAQKALAEAVHGSGQQFIEVMKMMLNDEAKAMGTDCPKIFVRSQEYVKEHAKEAAFFNATLLYDTCDCNDFYACEDEVSERMAIYWKLRGIVTETSVTNIIKKFISKTSAEIQEARLRDDSLRDITLYPANFCLYDCEKDEAVGVHDPDGEAVLYFGEKGNNEGFCNEIDFYIYLCGWGYNSLPAGVLEAVARAKESALRVRLADLNLQPHGYGIDSMFYEINPSDCDALTPAQKILAEAVHGSGQQFVDVMKMIHDEAENLGVGNPKIFVENPESVKKYAQNAPSFHSILMMDSSCNGNNFYAYEEDERRTTYENMRKGIIHNKNTT